MNVVAQIAALGAGLIHVMIFAFESLLFLRPDVHKRFLVQASDAPTVKPWAFNQGFYNLFLAVGSIGGIIVVWFGDELVGRTLVLFACGSMVAAAVVLVASDRRMIRAAAVQGVLPLVALIAALL